MKLKHDGADLIQNLREGVDGNRRARPFESCDRILQETLEIETWSGMTEEEEVPKKKEKARYHLQLLGK